MKNFSKRVRLYATLLILIVLLTASCSTARITSFTEPEYVGAGFKKVVVVSTSESISTRDEIESAFVSGLQDKGVFAEKSSFLFLPTRQYTKEQRMRRIEEGGFDAVIFISDGKIRTQTYMIPEIDYTKKKKDKETTYRTGGQTYTQRYTERSLYLFDVKTWTLVWRGESGAFLKYVVRGAINSLMENDLISDK